MEIRAAGCEPRLPFQTLGRRPGGVEVAVPSGRPGLDVHQRPARDLPVPDVSGVSVYLDGELQARVRAGLLQWLEKLASHLQSGPALLACRGRIVGERLHAQERAASLQVKRKPG